MGTYALRRTSSRMNGKSGKYMILFGQMQYQDLVSSDYGLHYSIQPVCTFNSGDCRESAALSFNGKYQIIANISDLSFSRDYGKTWSTLDFNITYGGLHGGVVGMSASGRYILIGKSDCGLAYSNDFGITWKTRDVDASVSSLYTPLWYNILISGNGKYQIGIGKYGATMTGSFFCYSSDYGKTWSTNLFGIWEVDNATSLKISYDGKFIMNEQYISRDYGKTYVDYTIGFKYETGNIPTEGFTKFDFINNGKDIYIIDSLYFAYKSHDYGKTWECDESLLYWSDSSFDIAISSDGNRLLGIYSDTDPNGNNGCFLYYSENKGCTFSSIRICDAYHDTDSVYGGYIMQRIYINKIY